MRICIHITLACCLCLWQNSTEAQVWKHIPPANHNSDTNAIYKWESQDDYHAAFGELILLTSGRFIYNTRRPMDHHQYSEGRYVFRNDTLVLDSDFQPGNLPVKLEYSDTALTPERDRRIGPARNLRGEVLIQAIYYFNFDTTLASGYYADLPLNLYRPGLFSNIVYLKVEVSPGISSNWIPVQQTKNYITARILSEKNFDKYHQKVLTNYRLIRNGDHLIDLTGAL